MHDVHSPADVLAVVQWEKEQELRNRYTQALLWNIAKILGRDAFTTITPTEFAEKLDDKRAIHDNRSGDEIKQSVLSKLG